MLSDRTRDALDGILLNIEAVAEFTQGMTLEQFKADRRTLYAVTRALEIISEATRRLPEDLKARHPRIKWHAIRGAGNVYRHTYSKVSASFVWDTAMRELEDLRQAVSRELDTSGPSASHLLQNESRDKE